MGNSFDRERYKVAIPQLENRIKTLEGSVEGLIVKHYAQDVTVPASNVKSIYFTGIDIKGYEPIAIAEMQTSGQYTSYLSFYRWDFNNDKDTVNIYVRNSRGDDASLSIEIAVVYLTTQARIKSVVSTGGGGGGGGTTDYVDLSNKPQINSTTLSGNKSSSDLGLAAASHSHTVSDITDFPSIPIIDSGHLSGASVSANSYLDRSVTFNKTFASAPNVVCSLASSATAATLGNFMASVINITTTGCTIRIFNSSSSSRTPGVEWIAVG